ncbi:MAG: DUF1549 domain-containing protein [Gemmataceae bacterium]
MRLLPYLPVILLVLSNPLLANELLPPGRPIPEVVDHYIEQAWKEQNLIPAPLADDATLLRRLTLDLVGRIPTTHELDAYLASSDPDKKVKLVDRLLASTGYQRQMTTELETMLVATVEGRRQNSNEFREYLTAAVKDNRSWDRIYRELILADEKAAKGSSQFLKARVKDLDRLTNDVSVLFFGVNISCAQCHDHPLVHDWKQDHYFGMKSFFARTFEAGSNLGERDVGVVQFKTTKNENRTAKMMFLTGKVVDAPGSNLSPDDLKKLKEQEKKQARGGKKTETAAPAAPKFSARQALVELSLQPQQRDFLARSIVNRLWVRFHGLGLVTPIDQMHSENAPSHPELLEWLARDTAENGYDLKRLVRGLVLSRTYARSSRFEGDKWPAVRSFGVARLRALTPTQLATSLRLATTDPDQLTSKGKPEEVEKRLEQLEASARGFASLIEQPREDFQIGVAEALLFSNNDRIQREFLTDGRDRLVGRMKELKTPDEAVELAVRTVLSRGITAGEKKAMLEYVGERSDRKVEAYRQLVWALLTSSEFRFNY